MSSIYAVKTQAEADQLTQAAATLRKHGYTTAGAAVTSVRDELSDALKTFEKHGLYYVDSAENAAAAFQPYKNGTLAEVTPDWPYTHAYLMRRVDGGWTHQGPSSTRTPHADVKDTEVVSVNVIDDTTEPVRLSLRVAQCAEAFLRSTNYSATAASIADAIKAAEKRTA